MSKPFADQLDALLANARSFADDVANDLNEQLRITMSIEVTAAHVREANMRALQHLLQLTDDNASSPEHARARDLANQIVEQWQ